MQCAPESEDVFVINNPANSSANETSQQQLNLSSQVQVATLSQACFPQEGTVLLIPLEVYSQVFPNSIDSSSQENGNPVSIIEWQPASQNVAFEAPSTTSIFPVQSSKTGTQTTSLVPVSVTNNASSSSSSDTHSLTENTFIIGTAQFELLKSMASDSTGAKTAHETKENNVKGSGKQKLTLEEYRKITGMPRAVNRKIAPNSLSKSVSGPSLSQTVTNISVASPTNGSGTKVVNSSEVSSVKIGRHYVVCTYCGFSSYNLEKCGRCQRKVCSNWTVRTQPVSSTLTIPEQPKYLEWVRRSCSSQPRTEDRKTVVVRRQTRQAEEPPCLTLSSDEEDASSSLFQTPKSVTSTENSSLNGDPPESEMADNAFAITGEELASKTLEEILIPKIGTHPYVSNRCRGVRFGPYKTVLKDDVYFTEYFIFMKVTQQDSQANELVWLSREELTCIDVCFTASSPIAFVRCSLDCSRRIAKQLKINISNEDSLKCFIVLMLETVSESAQLSLKQMYSGVLREISDALAQNQLFSTTGADAAARALYERKISPKRSDQGSEQESTATDRSALDNDTSTWLIWPPPPSRDGISITGQDYLCLEPDTFLNDVIIDFYLKYLVNSMLSEEQREKTHVFSCFFYQRLTTKPKTSRKKHPIEDDPKYTAAEKRHHRVKSWTKNVDLFSKDFLIIPINESSHWFLAIVCFPGLVGTATSVQGKAPSTKPALTSSNNTSQSPSLLGYTLATGKTVVIGATSITPVGPTSSNPNRGSETLCLTLANEERDEAISEEEEEQDAETKIADSLEQNNADETPANSQDMPDNSSDSFVKQPCILVFDSMAGYSRSRVIATLRDYLQVEHNVRKKDAESRTFTKDTIKGVNVRVPQQTNSSDCGIYVLQYVESFFKNPIKSFKIPLPSLRNWFSSEEVGSKRQELQQLIVSLIKEVNPDFVLRTLKKAPVDDEGTEEASNNGKLTQVSDESAATGTTVASETDKDLEKDNTGVSGANMSEGSALISGNTSPVLRKKVVGTSRKRPCKAPSEQVASDDTKQVNGDVSNPAVMGKKPKTDTSGV